MPPSRHRGVLAALGLAALTGCGGLVKPAATAPAGVSCDKLFVSGADLSAALQGRVAGECVLLATGTYTGNFVLPQDVSLMAGEGAVATLRGAAKGLPVLEVKGGARTLLKGLHIETSAGGGIAIDPGPVAMSGVTISGSAQAALTVSCTGSDCEGRQVTFEDGEVSRNAAGVVVRGAWLRLVRSAIRDTQGTSVAGGTGLTALAGAHVSGEDLVVENSVNLGVLLDGAATRFEGVRLTVRGNVGRGLLGQGLRGASALVVSSSTFTENSLMGLGVVDSEGLVVTDTTVSATRAVNLYFGADLPVPVGDGVAVMGHSRGARLERLTLVDNARAQALFDQADEGNALSGTAAGGQYRVVVQHSVAGVSVPADLVDPAPELPVVDAKVAVGP